MLLTLVAAVFYFLISRMRKGKSSSALEIGVGLLTILAIGMGCLVWYQVGRLSEEARAKETPRKGLPALPEQAPAISGEGMILDESDPVTEQKKAPTVQEMPFAVPVPGNSLSVTLPGENASLGEISIEKYSREGEATGQPLPRGTPVQIPNPNRSGEKIYFKVP